MIRNLALLCFLSLTLFACNSNSGSKGRNQFPAEITLSGVVSNASSSFVILEKTGEYGFDFFDSLQLDSKGAFSKTIKIEEPEVFAFSYPGLPPVTMVLAGEDVRIEMDADNPQNAKVTGSYDTDLLREIEGIFERFTTSQRDLSDRFAEASRSEDSELMSQIQADFAQMENRFKEELKSMIRSKEPSIVSLLLANFIGVEEDFTFLDSVSTQLRITYPKSRLVKEFAEMMDEYRSLSVGSPAPEISLPSPDGKIISLSDLRGKYVLIDFWAGWCRPCRIENPNVVRLYNQYKDSGFTVFGVSLDRTREEWIDAIEADGLVWDQVSDLKYFDSEAARTYRIEAIPATYLIDPNGVIIAKNLRGKTLEDKLESLFGR
jgi:peroxiredoxin